jgi:hypothetical protein
MRHLLDGGSNQEVLNKYVAGAADADSAAFVREYARRTLSRMAAGSDDEGDKW